MPYVAPEEALNEAVADIEALSSPDAVRVPIIGTPAYRVVLWRLPSGQEAHPLHRHPHSDEVIVVLSGSGEFRVGDNGPFTVRPPSVVFAPQGTPHHMRAVGDAPLVWLSFVAPNQPGSDQEDVSEDPVRT